MQLLPLLNLSTQVERFYLHILRDGDLMKRLSDNERIFVKGCLQFGISLFADLAIAPRSYHDLMKKHFEESFLNAAGLMKEIDVQSEDTNMSTNSRSVYSSVFISMCVEFILSVEEPDLNTPVFIRARRDVGEVELDAYVARSILARSQLA